MFILPAMLGKHGGEARCGSRSSVVVASTPDFSIRRMTRSAAKASGYKPSSAILIKVAPLRRPRAKKAKVVVDAPEPEETVPAIPPPTPIFEMQAVGAHLGEDQLTVEKLTGSPKNPSSHPVPNDE